MTAVGDIIENNLQTVRQEIAAATRRARRDASSVRLIAVTKYAKPEWMTALYDLGMRDFGESRPQQLEERAAQFPADIRWHLIGHLQRNKVRKALPLTSLIHSVDSVRLLESVDRIASESQLRPQVLLEVNVSGEASKQGFSADELRQAWPEIAACSHTDVAGLMTMAPLTDAPEAARRIFAELRQLASELNQQFSGPTLGELSMGMSGDFAVAIEEGATMVRVGSRLFADLDD